MNLATNLHLDDWLVREAMNLGGHRTKNAAITQALTEYVRYREQEKMLSLFGRVEFAPGYDHKRQRARG